MADEQAALSAIFYSQAEGNPQTARDSVALCLSFADNVI
jgi:hypothetical protein